MPETRISDYAAFLHKLGASNTDYFLEGGQAVNFWAEYYSVKGADSGLAPFLPFTSKDCDIWVSYAAYKYLRSQPDGGTLIEGTSPADGQLGIFSLDTDPKIAVDLMTNVYGIPQDKIPRLTERALIIDGIRVMDPIFLFQCKCHCLLDLDQIGRQDEKHVRMLSIVVPSHLENLLEETIAGNITERALLNELKLLLTIWKTSKCKTALQKISMNPEQLLPVRSLLACGLEKIQRFADTLRIP